MTLADWYSTGKYQDFVLLDGVVYPLPQGFSFDPSPVETSNVVTMASGRRRRDLVRLSKKFKFTWALATQATLTTLETIFTASLSATVLKLYLKKEQPASISDYDINTFDLIDPIKTKPRFRGRGLFIHESLSLELS